MEKIDAALAVIGIGKEAYDLRHDGHAAEWHNVACDAIGVLCGMQIVLPNDERRT